MSLKDLKPETRFKALQKITPIKKGDIIQWQYGDKYGKSIVIDIDSDGKYILEPYREE